MTSSALSAGRRAEARPAARCRCPPARAELVDDQPEALALRQPMSSRSGRRSPAWWSARPAAGTAPCRDRTLTAAAAARACTPGPRRCVGVHSTNCSPISDCGPTGRSRPAERVERRVVDVSTTAALLSRVRSSECDRPTLTPAIFTSLPGIRKLGVVEDRAHAVAAASSPAPMPKIASAPRSAITRAIARRRLMDRAGRSRGCSRACRRSPIRASCRRSRAARPRPGSAGRAGGRGVGDAAVRQAGSALARRQRHQRVGRLVVVEGVEGRRDARVVAIRVVVGRRLAEVAEPAHELGRVGPEEAEHRHRLLERADRVLEPRRRGVGERRRLLQQVGEVVARAGLVDQRRQLVDRRLGVLEKRREDLQERLEVLRRLAADLDERLEIVERGAQVHERRAAAAQRLGQELERLRQRAVLRGDRAHRRVRVGDEVGERRALGEPGRSRPSRCS